MTLDRRTFIKTGVGAAAVGGLALPGVAEAAPSTADTTPPQPFVDQIITGRSWAAPERHARSQHRHDAEDRHPPHGVLEQHRLLGQPGDLARPRHPAPAHGRQRLDGQRPAIHGQPRRLRPRRAGRQPATPCSGCRASLLPKGYQVELNGTFDVATGDVVRAMQRLHRLDPTGRVDLATWCAVSGGIVRQELQR